MAHTISTIRRAEQILGYGIGTCEGEREYPVIDGVVYTDLFEGDATVDGVTFTQAFNGVKNRTEYFNEIIPVRTHQKTVKVTAEWGSTEFMTDIKELLDWLEDNPSTDALDSAGTKSLRIKDYSETFGTAQEQTEDINTVLERGFGFYIRKPLIISFGEQPNAARYF